MPEAAAGQRCCSEVSEAGRQTYRQLQQVPPGLCCSGNDVYIACRFSLPYKHLLPGKEGGAGAMWNCEMSMLDVDKRSWILGPMYDMHTGQLLVSTALAICCRLVLHA